MSNEDWLYKRVDGLISSHYYQLTMVSVGTTRELAIQQGWPYNRGPYKREALYCSGGEREREGCAKFAKDGFCRCCRQQIFALGGKRPPCNIHPYPELCIGDPKTATSSSPTLCCSECQLLNSAIFSLFISRATADGHKRGREKLVPHYRPSFLPSSYASSLLPADTTVSIMKMIFSVFGGPGQNLRSIVGEFRFLMLIVKHS